MEQLDEELVQRRENRMPSYYTNELMALEDRRHLEQEYQEILKEVKEILNNKFREGYSHRVRLMLDKF